MASLVRLMVVVGMGIILTSKVFDNVIRKWFELGKVTKRKKSFTKYETWIELLILLIFVSVSYRIGIESSYIYIAILLFGVIFYGIEAIQENKYIKNSKEYLVTILIGLLKTLLFMILIFIYYFFKDETF